MSSTPTITALRAIPVAGRDSMLLNLSGAHGPFFTRNVVILKDSAGNTGVGEVPGGEKIRKTIDDARALVVGQPLGRYNAVLAQIQAGKLKAIAITSAKRSPLLPNVPTLSESGVKNAEVYSWQAMAAPRGLPADVKAKLVDASTAALRDPEVAKKMTDLGFEIVANTPEQFAKYQAQELARWKTVIDNGKITAN